MKHKLMQVMLERDNDKPLQGRVEKVVSDGLACFNAVTDMGCGHEVHIVGSGPESVEHPAFHWVNTMLGNVKNALRGTYHAIQPDFTTYLA